MYDLIIKNGAVIDGTGPPAQYLDIAILDGKIAKIARNIREESKEIIDAKGLLREGMDADICIFDADTITDNATYTEPNQRCTRLNYVLLGGEIVVEDAIYNGKRKGRFIGRMR